MWEKEQRLLEVKEKKRKCLEKLEARNRVKQKDPRKQETTWRLETSTRWKERTKRLEKASKMKILAPEISTGTRISRNHHRKQQIRRCIYTISKRQINRK